LSIVNCQLLIGEGFDGGAMKGLIHGHGFDELVDAWGTALMGWWMPGLASMGGRIALEVLD
jgi:hypothetical protein